MKASLIFMGLITLFITLPLQIYGSWLLYNHVHATSLMWFIWWIQTPWTILISIFAKFAEAMAKKK